MASPLESLILGMNAGSQLRQQKNSSRLADLAAQAYGAAPDQRQGLVQQAIGIDANSGFALGQNLQKTDDARNEQLVQMARVLTGAPDQFKDSIYQRMKPALAQMGMDAGTLPASYDAQVEQTARALVEAYSQKRVGTNAELQTFQAMTQGMSPEDVQKARRIQLGLDGRASSAAIAYKVLKGADGRNRLVAADPREPGAIVIDGQSGFGGGFGQPPAVSQDGSLSVSIDGVPAEQQQRIAQTAALMRQAGYSDADIDAFVSAQSDVAPGQRQGGFSGAFVSPSEAESAFNTEAAKQAAQLAALPQQEAIKTQAAIATEQGKTGVQTQADIAKDQRQKASALAQFESAVKGLDSGLSGTTTGFFAGRLPAVTANQQIAEGGVAAMAPILKQLFRTAGEGTFTDKDQELLMRMLPTRQDLPEARQAKLANITAIVRAKLSQQAVPQPGASKVLKFNPATGRIE